MITHYQVQGTQVNVQELQVDVDTVYIRDNITRIESDDFTGWQYDEIQYSLREYQELVGIKSDELSNDTETMAEMVFVSLDDLQMIADTLAHALEEIELLKGGN